MNFNAINSIVIGPSQIDYFRIIRKGKNVSLNALAYYDFEFEKFDELEGIIESISSITPKDSLFNLSIINPDIIKHIYFYKKSSQNIKTNILRDLKSDYEIKLQDYLIDYEENKLDSKKIAFATAIPKELFNGCFTYIKKHKNIKLFSLETDIASLRRLVNRFYDKEKTNLCINMRKHYSNIFALKNGSVLLDRKIQYGFDNFVDDIVKEGGIERIKAINLLKETGIYKDNSASEKENTAYNVMVSSFDKLSIEIQRTMDYLLSNLKLGKVDNIVTLGFINGIKKSETYLSKLFSMKVDKLETPKMLEFGESVDFSMVKNMIYFDIGAGAALRTVK